VKLIFSLFQFLKNHKHHNTHAVAVTQDTDFFLILNKLKGIDKVKTHLLTGFQFKKATTKGLADVVISYPKAFSSKRSAPETPANPSPMNKKKKHE
jgi:hypothetical protein